MRSLLALVFAFALLFAANDNLVAETPRATADEAKAMVARAIALYREKGPDEAFAMMNRGEAGFRDRELFIFAYGPDRKVVVQAAAPERVGLDADTIKDVDGKLYGVESLRVATPEGTWVDYKAINPVTGDTENKSSWLVRVDGYVFGCGVYRP